MSLPSRNLVPLIIALMFVGSLVAAPDAWAQDKHKYFFKAPPGVSKYTQQQVIDVGNVPGHQLRIYELHTKYTTEAPAIELFKLHQEHGLGIRLAHSNQKEIDHPNTPAWVKNTAASLIYTMQVSFTPGERSRLRKIHAILTGNGKPENVEEDARHVFEAQKYGSYFVTTDDRILRRAHELRTVCTVEILRPSEFLELVRNYNPPRAGA